MPSSSNRQCIVVGAVASGRGAVSPPFSVGILDRSLVEGRAEIPSDVRMDPASMV